MIWMEFSMHSSAGVWIFSYCSTPLPLSKVEALPMLAKKVLTWVHLQSLCCHIEAVVLQIPFLIGFSGIWLLQSWDNVWWLSSRGPPSHICIRSSQGLEEECYALDPLYPLCYYTQVVLLVVKQLHEEEGYTSLVLASYLVGQRQPDFLNWAEFLLQVVNAVIPQGQFLSENALTAGELATHILGYLYEKLNEFCLVQDGEEEPYHTLLVLFIGSLRPLTEALDSWLHEGTLSDPFGELFFYANYSIAVEDSAFWEQGYLLRQWESRRVDFMFRPTTFIGALENYEKKGGRDNVSPRESSLAVNSANFNVGNQSHEQRLPVCPIFMRPIARAIVSAGKSLQLLRHVQREHAEVFKRIDACDKNALGIYENSVSSAIWMPLFPQFSNRKILADAGLQQNASLFADLKNCSSNTSGCEKVPDFGQGLLGNRDGSSSLFEKFSTTLVRLLGYGSCTSENHPQESGPSASSGKDCRTLVANGDSVVANGDEYWKLKMQQGSCWNSHLNVTADHFQKLNIKMDCGFLKFDGQDLSILPGVQGVNDVLELPKQRRLGHPFQTGDIDQSELNLFRPENAAFSISIKGFRQQKDFWDIELNLSKCCFLPPLNDQHLRDAIFNKQDMDTNQNSELGRGETDAGCSVREEVWVKQNSFTGHGERRPDSSLNTSNGTNYACGFGFGKALMCHTDTDSKAIELLYPYPTLLPSFQVDCVGQQILSKLMEEWRLMDELAVLRAIYLFGSGDLLQQFSAVLFNKLDRGEPWDDYYELNTMLQESIRSSADGMLLPSLDSLVVTISSRSNGAPDHGFGTVPLQFMGRSHSFGIDTLDSLRFAYKVAWPLELIADQIAIKKYNQVMGFLLKVKRAKFVLDKARRWMWKVHTCLLSFFS
eukprot:Gb_02392 [translate_table: standard]